MFVSPRQINAQLPFSVEGSSTLVLRTPWGVSDNFNMTVSSAAPSIFRNGVAGPQTDIALIMRERNGQVVTPSNPIHHGDVITIYATGLGRTNPSVESGVPAPADPAAASVIQPLVTIGSVPVEVLFAGLTPGEVGIYEIKARVGGNVAPGLDRRLQVTAGGVTASAEVRVVD
jgi:uncharacterized protein (TIGR03437 family)